MTCGLLKRQYFLTGEKTKVKLNCPDQKAYKIANIRFWKKKSFISLISEQNGIFCVVFSKPGYFSCNCKWHIKLPTWIKAKWRCFTCSVAHSLTHSLRQIVGKISQFSCWDIEIWYVGSLNTISEIVTIGFISTCPPWVNRVN